MKTTQLEPNPYTPPETSCNDTSAEWYLVSACRYFKWIGWTVVAYMACVGPMALHGLLTEKSPALVEAVGGVAILAAMLAFFGAMIRTAMRLPDDFERLYRRARWMGILAGACGFPILTVPAFVAVSRLAKYRVMLTANDVGARG